MPDENNSGGTITPIRNSEPPTEKPRKIGIHESRNIAKSIEIVGADTQVQVDVYGGSVERLFSVPTVILENLVGETVIIPLDDMLEALSKIGSRDEPTVAMYSVVWPKFEDDKD